MIKKEIRPPKTFLLKTCTKCGNDFGAESFTRTKSVFYPDGYLPICNDCLADILREGDYNWDLVDSVAPICIGKQLINEDDEYIYNVLRHYTKSEDVWTKRIGIVSLLYIAKENRKDVVFRVLDDVFYEEYHLFQKATGWVLRELYKVNPNDTLMYLVDKNNNKKIPNILKSYATEKMSSKEKSMLK